MESIIKYKELIEGGLKNLSFDYKPDSLYNPIKYFLNIRGKRIRPVLTLMSSSCFKCDPKLALNAALSIELFHNFTLIHDDIMDSASSRRGKETIHSKWGINSAILSGDVMLIMAYELLEKYDNKIYKHLSKLLNKTARQVCEGQQMDIDFESNSNSTFDQYIKMISFKTSVLLGCALKMGAIIANVSSEDQDNIYDFGINLGLAFQLQDDYLDTFGYENLVGKKIGGDIIENKKTILFHMAMINSNETQKKHITGLYNSKDISNENKVYQITSLFKESKADISSKELVNQYTKKAIDSLNKVNIDKNFKDQFIVFAKNLMKREL